MKHIRQTIITTILIVSCNILANSQNYSHHCEPDVSYYPELQGDGFTSISANFNDDQGNCVSTQFVVIANFGNGISETWISNGQDTIDFGNQQCCDNFFSGGGGSLGNWKEWVLPE